MTHPAPALLTAHRIRAIASAMRGWLFAFAGWLLDAFGTESAIGRAVRRSVRRDLDQAEREVRMLVMIAGVMRLPTVAPRRTGRRPCHIPPNTPRGFRAVTRDASLRLDLRGIVPRTRSVRGRITVLLRVLRRLERVAAAFVARVLRGPHGARCVAVAPAAITLTGRAVSPMGDDTS